MEVYFSQQALAFLWAVVLGAILGAVNDCFRVGRILWKRGNFWVFLEDLCFSFLASLLTILCLTRTNFGQVRLFLLIGEVLGFFLYFHTLGALVTRVAAVLARILGFLGRKIKGIFALFMAFLGKIMNFLKKLFIFSFRWFRIDMIRIERRRASHGKESKETEPRR